ncbi:MAG: SMP-30/gluconolactonase/LRE family protein [Anaerolineae bacterium]
MATLSDLIVSTKWVPRASGLRFTEGPLWHPEGYLIFSDIPGDTIYRLDEDGTVTPWRRPSGNSNGLTCAADGRIVACEHGNRQVSIGGPCAATQPVATHYGSARLNSPNDVVMRSDGTIYFTDPPYGIQPEQQELPHQGVYRVTPDGELSLVVPDMLRPNGLALSPDESVLYIDDSGRKEIRAYDVRPDGSLWGGRIWADMASDEQGVPDGMKVDQEGNVYCTGPGGIWVLDAKARVLGILRGPEHPANVAFGDADWCTLYITAQTGVYSLRTQVPGIPTH